MVIDCTIVRRYVHDYSVSHGGIGLQLLHHRRFVRSVRAASCSSAYVKQPLTAFVSIDIFSRWLRSFSSWSRPSLAATFPPLVLSLLLCLLSLPTQGEISRHKKGIEHFQVPQIYLAKPELQKEQGLWTNRRLLKRTTFYLKIDCQDGSCFVFTHVLIKSWKHRTAQFSFPWNA